MSQPPPSSDDAGNSDDAANTDDTYYANYRSLRVRRHPHGVLEVVMSGEGANRSALATANARMHYELAEIWRDIDRDPDTRVALIRGEGKGFSAGGDLQLVEDMANDFDVRARVWREARDLVYNVINCGKPIVSAMHGPAVGAGLVAGLLSDISIAAKTARIIDGHTRLGVAAGDHAAIVWPLLCGMAKAKYYLMLCEPVSGEEAERIGLVSLAVDEGDLLPRAFEVARKLADGSQTAIRWTKYALNNWLRSAGPAFDTSLALEFMGFAGQDVREGVSSLRERRAPDFGGGDPWRQARDSDGVDGGGR
ncbi:enoyl-CoA hydratase/isomerase family protein [Paraburkholderia sp.]|uniref:enoyl-CoA hydratase/isomerase family protein n=1 Tax=Paraburkholderia sp. TaxID=1926495 RepID=UPI0039E6153B